MVNSKEENNNFSEQNKEKICKEFSYNARFVWGTLVTNLRQDKMFTLHTACGEIRDVEFVGSKLKVNVKEDYLFSILNKKENVDKILGYLKKIDERIEIEFCFINKQRDNIVENIEKLKKIFGEDLKIK